MTKKTRKINQYKTDKIDYLKGLISSAKDLVFSDYRGLNVAQITELREKLKESDSTFHVIKNRYTKIAINELKLPEVSDFLIGPTALALVQKDAGPVSKVLLDFSKDSSLRIKGGIVPLIRLSPVEPNKTFEIGGNVQFCIDFRFSNSIVLFYDIGLYFIPEREYGRYYHVYKDIDYYLSMNIGIKYVLYEKLPVHNTM